MPTADGKPTAEDVVALMQTKPGAFALSQHLDVVEGGLIDLVNRVRNLEHGSLVAVENDRVLGLAHGDHEKRIQSLEGDRGTDRTRLDKLEAAPVAETKRVDDLEKRVRTVEGAVGSTSFAAAKAAPDKAAPFKGPDATAPVSDQPKSAPSGTIFGGPGATQ